MKGWGIFLIILLFLIILGGGGYIAYSYYRARKLGLPPPNLNPLSHLNRESNSYRAPAPAPGGIQGWISDKVNGLRNKRTAGGAYESTGGGNYAGSSRPAGRGFGPLDPDEAWDARVDNEASGYYEEQELGLQDPGHGPYGGGGYGNNAHIGVGGIEEGRGRSRSRQRELDERYDEAMHRDQDGNASLNPFGDHAETSNISLKSMSPRPAADTSYHGANAGNKKTQGSDSADTSPTERRSMFRENV